MYKDATRHRSTCVFLCGEVGLRSYKRRRSKAVMWTGFVLLIGQWSVFYWLTW
jgi:hypothetical protein